MNNLAKAIMLVYGLYMGISIIITMITINEKLAFWLKAGMIILTLICVTYFWNYDMRNKFGVVREDDKDDKVG